tara:strand:+ start:34992 stop:36572 length:1581 start_codon:yes stop_codon:yes gene_type:complete
MSLGDPKVKKSSFMDNLRGIGKGFNFADGAFLALTALNLAANPKGAKGIHNVIKDNQKRSTEYASLTARNALSNLRSNILPAIKENEAWMKDTTQYITNELQGVDDRFIQALIKANKLDEFRLMTKKINDARVLNGQAKLTAQDMEEMMPALKNYTGAVSPIEGFENTPEKVGQALRKFYAGYEKLLKTARDPNQFRAGIFASSYGSPGAGLDLANQYLRGAGQTQIGDEMIAYDRLSELPLGSIGFDQEQLEAVPGGIDYSAGVPNELDAKIKKKLSEHINTISNVGDVASISNTLSSIQNNATVSQFGQIFNPETGQFNIMWSGNPEELQKASEGIAERLRIVRAKIDVARQNNENADLSRLEDEEQRLKIRQSHHRNMENLSRAGNKLYALLHREAYVKTIREMKPDANGDIVVGNDYISILGEKMADAIKLASNRRRESQTQFTQDALIDIVNQDGIGQDYLFADRKSLLLFIDAMGGVQGGILQRGTRLRYTTSEGGEDTVTVQEALSPEFINASNWRLSI